MAASKIRVYVLDCEHLGTTPLTDKFVKTPKKSAAFDHMLIESLSAKFDNLSIISKEKKNRVL